MRAIDQFLGGLEAGIQPGKQAGRGPGPTPALVSASGSPGPCSNPKEQVWCPCAPYLQVGGSRDVLLSLFEE